MVIEIKVPSPGESITEVTLATWLVKDGDFVEKNQEIAEVESDKATLPLIAAEAGKIIFLVQEGETIGVGTVACKIDTDKINQKKPNREIQPKISETKKNSRAAKVEIPVLKEDFVNKIEIKQDIKEKVSASKPTQNYKPDLSAVKVTPLAKKVMEMNGLSVEDIISGLKKITSKEVTRVLSADSAGIQNNSTEISREVKVTDMSQLRKKLSQRLVAVKNETAMLTTFNEADMSELLRIRKKYQEEFTTKYGVKLGLMSFFVKAATIALQHFTKVNSYIENEKIVTPAFVDVCIAVQTEKGLMVPVLRNTEMMNIAEIELKIAELAQKARSFRISIEEMTGGTFTITNGGVFGSMLSTPIINPPQSAILGMHNIVERPVALNGKVEIRPVMYLALSYDHRIIDGADSVSFLVKIKELIENPLKMFGEGEPEKTLLGLS